MGELHDNNIDNDSSIDLGGGVSSAESLQRFMRIRAERARKGGPRPMGPAPERQSSEVSPPTFPLDVDTQPPYIETKETKTETKTPDQPDETLQTSEQITITPASSFIDEISRSTEPTMRRRSDSAATTPNSVPTEPVAIEPATAPVTGSSQQPKPLPVASTPEPRLVMDVPRGESVLDATTSEGAEAYARLLIELARKANTTVAPTKPVIQIILPASVRKTIPESPPEEQASVEHADADDSMVIKSVTVPDIESDTNQAVVADTDIESAESTSLVVSRRNRGGILAAIRGKRRIQNTDQPIQQTETVTQDEAKSATDSQITIQGDESMESQPPANNGFTFDSEQQLPPRTLGENMGGAPVGLTRLPTRLPGTSWRGVRRPAEEPRIDTSQSTDESDQAATDVTESRPQLVQPSAIRYVPEYITGTTIPKTVDPSTIPLASRLHPIQRRSDLLQRAIMSDVVAAEVADSIRAEQVFEATRAQAAKSRAEYLANEAVLDAWALEPEIDLDKTTNMLSDISYEQAMSRIDQMSPAIARSPAAGPIAQFVSDQTFTRFKENVLIYREVDAMIKAGKLDFRARNHVLSERISDHMRVSAQYGLDAVFLPSDSLQASYNVSVALDRTGEPQPSRAAYVPTIHPHLDVMTNDQDDVAEVSARNMAYILEEESREGGRIIGRNDLTGILHRENGSTKTLVETVILTQDKFDKDIIYVTAFTPHRMPMPKARFAGRIATMTAMKYEPVVVDESTLPPVLSGITGAPKLQRAPSPEAKPEVVDGELVEDIKVKTTEAPVAIEDWGTCRVETIALNSFQISLSIANALNLGVPVGTQPEGDGGFSTKTYEKDTINLIEAIGRVNKPTDVGQIKPIPRNLRRAITGN